MFQVHTGIARDCNEVSRRQFLQIGGLSILGLALPDFLRLRAAGASPDGRGNPKARNCILLWMQGGPSHIDSFDPKPDAPVEIRGEFGTVPTTLPGVRFADPLPMLAKQ